MLFSRYEYQERKENLDQEELGDSRGTLLVRSALKMIDEGLGARETKLLEEVDGGGRGSVGVTVELAEFGGFPR